MLYLSTSVSFAGTGDTVFKCVGEPVRVYWRVDSCPSPSYVSTPPAKCEPKTPVTSGSGSADLQNASSRG